MKRLRTDKESVDNASEEVESNEELTNSTAAEPEEKCKSKVMPRFRSSTALARKKRESAEIIAKQHHYKEDRPHRPRQQAEIEENKRQRENYVNPREKLDMAILNKKIWSGYRGIKDGMPGIGWSPGFAEDWWNDYAKKKYGTNGFICTKHGQYMDCAVNVLQADHRGLEIGHKDSFYKNIDEKCDMVSICDGKAHWFVYLVEDIQKANEVAKNLEPQCHPCNMKQNNQQSGGFEPQFEEDCPGEGCRVRKIDSL